ncbi:hypothetical protein NQ315_002395 [Exocentrus adspersus]|uniref:Uncharacterized protein n=1 Tax=Exocentrus adspersus TaxID=1586481 RepID=A0AAV8VSL7_9CUCU|nr:hypothetical protein NQ315_002395 [Exocentrus adspersus]
MLKFKRDLLDSRTFLNYFLILILLMPHTISDKHQQLVNRPNSIQKRHFQDSIDQSEDYHPQPTQHTGCSSCKMREEIKIRNLEMIKGEILRRMGFQQAPNITGKELPQIPSRYLAMVDPEYGMQSDEPPEFKTGFTITEEEDEYHVKTQKVITFAQPYKR